MQYRKVQLPEDHDGRLEFVRGRLMSTLGGDSDSLSDFARAVRPWIIAIRLEREAFFLGNETEIASRSITVDEERSSILSLWRGKVNPERMSDLARLVANFAHLDAVDELLQILSEISHDESASPSTCPCPQPS